MGWDVVAALAISAASAAYSKKLADDALSERAKFDKDTDPPLSERGTVTNYNIGYWPSTGDLVWASGRKRNSNDIYYEYGMMIIGVGPLHRIDEIWINGENTKFQGPITPETHPSGTEIVIPGKNGGTGPGTFQIYWGEEDQPVCDELVSESGFNSNWKNIAYAWWTKKKLSTSPIWPTVQFICTSFPTKSQLTGSSSYRDESFVLSTDSQLAFPIQKISAAGKLVLGIISTLKNPKSHFRVGDPIEITGNTGVGVDGTYTIASISQKKTNTGVEVDLLDPTSWYFTKILIELEEDTSAFENDGYAIVYERSENAGANAAHILDQLLFAQFPWGLERDRTKYDINSLELVGIQLENENLWLGVRCNRRDMSKVLADLIADAGIMIYWDTNTGKYTFKLIRKVDESEIITIDEEIITSENPNDELVSRPPANYQFSFKSSALNFEDETIRVSEDPTGRLNYTETQEIELTTVSSKDSASRVAERRALEGQSDFQKIENQMSYYARLLQVGSRVRIPGKSLPFIVIDKQHLHNENDVKFTLVRDRYSGVASDFLHPSSYVSSQADPDAPLLLTDVLELPETQSIGFVSVMFLSVRDNVLSEPGTVWFSQNGLNYTPLLTGITPVCGGTLTDGIAEETEQILDIDVDFLGPDLLDNVIDNSANDSAYYGGAFWLVIFENNSYSNYEILYVKKATLVSGTTVTLEGCIRSREGTARRQFPAGSRCYFFVRNVEEVEQLIVSLAGINALPGDTLDVKILDIGDSLEDSESYDMVLYGRGIKPQAPGNLRVQNSNGRSIESEIPVYYLDIGTDDCIIQWTQVCRYLDSTLGAGGRQAGQVDNMNFPDNEDTKFLILWFDDIGVLQETVVIDIDALLIQASSPPTTLGLFAVKAASALSTLMSGNTHLDVRMIYYRNGWYSPMTDPIRIKDGT